MGDWFCKLGLRYMKKICIITSCINVLVSVNLPSDEWRLQSLALLIDSVSITGHLAIPSVIAAENCCNPRLPVGTCFNYTTRYMTDV